jgi:hypothetical protein
MQQTTEPNEPAGARPDLAAHEQAMRLPESVLVRELRDHLGVRLVTYLAGVGETRAVHAWVDGTRQVRNPEVIDRLRLVHQIVGLITRRDSDHVAQAWLMGLNPKLDDRSPARLMREGALHDVGPQVLAAARDFAAVG